MADAIALGLVGRLPATAAAAQALGTGYAGRVQAVQQYLAAIDPLAYASARRLPANVSAFVPSWGANVADFGGISGAGYVTDQQSRTYSVIGNTAGGALTNTYRRDGLTGTWSTVATTFPTAPQAGLVNRLVADSTGKLWGWSGSISASGGTAFLTYTTAAGWSTLAQNTSAPNYYLNASLAIDGQDRIYVIAGSSVGAIVTGRYTPLTNTWESLAAEPSTSTGRYDAGAVFDAASNSILVLGGGKVVNSTNVTDDRVTAYSITAGTWSARASMPASRHNGVTVQDARGRVYVLTGHAGNPGQNATSTAYRYTVSTNTWETLASSSITRGSAIGGRDAAGRLFVTGGNDGNVSTPTYRQGTETLTLEATYSPGTTKALAALIP